MGNAVWTTDARAKLPANAGLSPLCPYCTLGVPERLDHVWWVCPAWRHVREKYYPGVDNLADFLGVYWWPNATRFCGIFHKDSEMNAEDAKTLHNMMIDIYLQRLEVDAVEQNLGEEMEGEESH